MSIRRGYVATSIGQLHYRTAGEGAPIVLLSYSFLSSLSQLGLIERLGRRFKVYALDTPGCGASDPFGASRRPTVEDFADVLAEAMDGLGLRRPAVYASHSSAKIALACCVRHPESIGFFVCESLAAPTTPALDAYIHRYIKPFNLSQNGAHIIENWTMLRDFRRYFPWFSTSAKDRLQIDQQTVEQDHLYALDLFCAEHHYGDAYEAALRFSPIESLKALETSTVFIAREQDVLASYFDVIRSVAPLAKFERVGRSIEEWQDRLEAILTHAPSGVITTPVARPGGAGPRAVFAMPHGDLEVRLYGDAGSPAVLALHDVPGCSAMLDPLCLQLATSHRVLAPDLPGCNLSDPLPTADAELYVATLADALDQADIRSAVIVADGISSSLALAVAARHPKRVERLVLNGACLGSTPVRRTMARAYCPPIIPTRQGGYVMETWQRARDMEMQWPWYNSSREAIRSIDPLIDSTRLHLRLVAILRQLDHYGDACAAALLIDAEELISAVSTPTTVLVRTCDPMYPDPVSLPGGVTQLPIGPGEDAALSVLPGLISN